jgi:Domain of unknown function (DUF5063)
MTHREIAASFAEPAKELCDLLKSGDLRDERTFDAIHRLLPALYSLALAMPLVVGDESAEANSPTPEQRREVCARVAEAFGHRNLYRQVYDPYAPEDDAPLWGIVADDLADIFGDLESGLYFWRLDRPDDAIWEWRFGVEQHWGNHVVDVLRALQWLRFDYGIPAATDGGSPAA